VAATMMDENTSVQVGVRSYILILTLTCIKVTLLTC